MSDPSQSSSGAVPLTPRPPAASEQEVLELRTRLAELEHRLAAAQAETAQTRERASRERLRFETELERHRALLEDRSRRLDRIRHDLDRLRANPLIRLALAVRSRLRGPAAQMRSARTSFEAHLAGVRDRLPGGNRSQASAADERRLVAALRTELRGAPQPGTGKVTIAITVEGSGLRLPSLLARLADTAWPSASVVLLLRPGAAALPAEAETALTALAARDGWSVTRQTGDLTQLAALRAAEPGAWDGGHVAFLHDDVEPFDGSWLARLVSAQADRDAGAVTGRLIVPRRKGRRSGGPGDLTVDQLGVDFGMQDGMPRPRPALAGTDPLAAVAKQRAGRPAVSDACVLVPADALDQLAAAPGDDPALKLVEFCLELWAAGRTVLLEGMAVLFHDHPAPGQAEPPLEDPYQPVVDRWGPQLYREVLHDRLRGDHRWSSDPIHAAITLTRNDQAAPYGDWYTAHELGDALAGLGWRISYIERHQDHWYELPDGVDVVIALLDLIDISRLPRHVLKVAWIRNWTDRWLSHPWFNDYDVVLASSRRSKELIEAGSAKTASLMPLATNPGRFKPMPANPAMQSDAAFVGSSWGEERGISSAMGALAAAGRKVRIWGRGWDAVPATAPFAGGVLPYESVPAVYASTKLVVDDTASPTKPYGAVNSRLFDALASGVLVVTDNEMGARELFDEDFPVWTSPESLVATAGALLDDDARREELVARYRRIVLDRHTYARRADEVRTALVDWTLARRVALHIGPQSWDLAPRWGDTHFARDVQRQFERRGHPASIAVFGERAEPIATRCDIAVHIFGVRAPETRPSQLKLLWVISHPDRITSELCAPYDAIFVASDLFLEHLRDRTDVPLYPLHQATDPDRFTPDPDGPVHELLFVGNSRGVRRQIVDDLAGTPHDLAVYGGDWTPALLDPKFLRAEWIPNDEVHSYYSGAAILLNDHWQDMRDEGFISNRLYDALASGAFIISDDVPGVAEEFDGGVVTYRRKEELLALVDRYLADPDARREVANRGRAAVLARHTFGHRVETMLAVGGPLLEGRPSGIATGPTPGRLV